jgi:creatinine amidohydrolase
MLVAPSINYGIGLPCDSCYAGSSSIGYRELRNTAASLVDWWKGQGFKRFFFVSAHGDPFHIKALESTGHKNVHVMELYDGDLAGVLEKQKCAKHACEAETSVMLCLFPKTVRKDKIADFETPFEKFKPYLYHKKKRPIPGSPGCQGHPSAATSEKGEKIVRLIKAAALNRIRKSLKAGF